MIISAIRMVSFSIVDLVSFCLCECPAIIDINVALRAFQALSRLAYVCNHGITVVQA